jgi:hypothetical protein
MASMLDVLSQSSRNLEYRSGLSRCVNIITIIHRDVNHLNGIIAEQLCEFKPYGPHQKISGITVFAYWKYTGLMDEIH